VVNLNKEAIKPSLLHSIQVPSRCLKIFRNKLDIKTKQVTSKVNKLCSILWGALKTGGNKGAETMLLLFEKRKWQLVGKHVWAI